MPRMIVLDVETTGLDPDKHDIIQIAGIALTYSFLPDKTVQPFYMMIKPAHYPQQEKEVEKYTQDIQSAMNINKLSMDKILDYGFNHIKAAELFEEWWHVQSQGQPVELLCQNYPFDSLFLKKWLGEEHFKFFFSRYYRDTFVAAQFLRDRSTFFGELDPFPDGLGLGKLCKALGINRERRAHDAFSDCIDTAMVYKECCTYVGMTREMKEKPKELLSGL